MAFADGYSVVLKNEGWYANVKGDAGGMTYAGIAYNIYPNWQGWAVIDAAIKDYSMNYGNDLPNNYHIPQLDSAVQSFYQDLWNRSMAGQISFVPTQVLYFDFYVNSAKAVQVVQQVLVDRGAKISVDNAIGPQTITAINADKNQNSLHDAILNARKDYLVSIASFGLNAQFLTGWLKRLQSFPPLVTTRIGVGLFIAGLITWLILRQSMNHQNSHKK